MQLSIAKRGENYAVPVETKLRLFRNLSHASKVYIYRAQTLNYSVNSLATSTEIHMFLIWDIQHIPTSPNSSQSATGLLAP